MARALEKFFMDTLIGAILMVVVGSFVSAYLISWLPPGIVMADLTMSPLDWGVERRTGLVLLWCSMLGLVTLSATS